MSIIAQLTSTSNYLSETTAFSSQTLQKRVAIFTIGVFAALALYKFITWYFRATQGEKNEHTHVMPKVPLENGPLSNPIREPAKKPSEIATVITTTQPQPEQEMVQPKDVPLENGPLSNFPQEPAKKASETATALVTPQLPPAQVKVEPKEVFKMELVVTEKNTHAAKVIQKVFRRHLYIKRNLKAFGKRSYGPRVMKDLPSKILEQGAQVGIVTNPTPPLRSNALDETRAETWVNLHEEKNRALVKKFISSIKHYSFEEFENALRQSIETFNLKIMNLPPEKRNYILLVGPWNSKNDIKTRSNGWVASLALKYLAHPPSAILNYNEEINLGLYPNLNRFLFVDDAAYSGTQLVHTIHDLKLDVSNRPDTQIHFVVPFVSTHACERIYDTINRGKYKSFGIDMGGEYRPWKVKFVVEKFKVFPTLEHIFSKQERIQLNRMLESSLWCDDEKIATDNVTKSLTYFDHKVPDYFSTFEETMTKGAFLGVTYKVIEPVLAKEGFVVNEKKTDDEVKKYNARYIELRDKLCYHPFIPTTIPPYKLLKKDNLDEFLKALSKDNFGDGKLLTNYQEERYPTNRYAIVETKNGIFALDKECQIPPQKIG